MAKCCVCAHRSERNDCHFYKFRKSPGARKRWMRGLNITISPGQRRLCSCHFPNNDISKTPTANTVTSSPRTPSNKKCCRGLFGNNITPIRGEHQYANFSVTYTSSESGESSLSALSNSRFGNEDKLDRYRNKWARSPTGNDKTTPPSPWKVAPLPNIRESEEISELKNQIKKYEDTIYEMAQENATHRMKISEMEGSTKKLKDEIAAQEIKLKDLTISLSQENSDLKMSISDMQKRIIELNQIRSKLEGTIEDQKCLLMQVSDKVNGLTLVNNDLIKKVECQEKELNMYARITKALKNEKLEYLKKQKTLEQKHLFKNFITESNVSHYTGLPNLGTFYWLLSMIPEELNYYSGTRVLSLSREDQLFVTLFKFRRNVSHQVLADWFRVSIATVSNIIITWLSALHIVLVEGIMMQHVPSLDKVRQSMPEAFERYPNCRMILDCTEMQVQSPLLMSKHNEVYSSYKSRTTFKGLIVIAPNGTVIFASELFPGSTSDKNVVFNCGILDLMETGDAVMADKGFTIKDILPPGVDLNLPPFKETPQFSRGQVFETLEIARSRIHVERAILRVKYFHILDLIPHSLFQFSSKVFQVCAALTNLRCPLIKEVEDTMRYPDQ